jgi:hypothetical protein
MKGFHGFCKVFLILSTIFLVGVSFVITTVTLAKVCPDYEQCMNPEESFLIAKICFSFMLGWAGLAFLYPITLIYIGQSDDLVFDNLVFFGRHTETLVKSDFLFAGWAFFLSFWILSVISILIVVGFSFSEKPFNFISLFLVNFFVHLIAVNSSCWFSNPFENVKWKLEASK